MATSLTMVANPTMRIKVVFPSNFIRTFYDKTPEEMSIFGYKSISISNGVRHVDTHISRRAF
jgi:hypothetical protein